MAANYPESTPPLRTLWALLHTIDGDGELGKLTRLREECYTLMKEIEKTAREVKGKATSSTRYLYAREIAHCIDQLEKLAKGRYTFNLPADKG